MLLGAKQPSIYENIAETGVGTVDQTAPALVFCFSAVKQAQYFSRFFTEQRSWQNSTLRDSNSKKTAGVAENFACKSGCIGGKARCSCAVRCVDLRTSSTPVLLSWIVLAWLSHPILFEQRSVSHRFSPKKNIKATDKVALISERYLAGGLSCLLKASLV